MKKQERLALNIVENMQIMGFSTSEILRCLDQKYHYLLLGTNDKITEIN